MTVRVLPIVLVLATTITSGTGQLPAGNRDETAGTAVIVGQVIDPGSGKGVPGAIVNIAGPPLASVLNPAVGSPASAVQPQVLTNADGRFLFRDLRKGTYHINASKPGYLTGAHGARRPGGGGAPIEIDDGEHVTDLVVPIWKWGAISGTVVDEAGEPVVGLEVRAYLRSAGSGRRQVTPAGMDTTDDRGEYRIANLTPGDYVVAAISTQSSVPTSVADAFRDGMQSNDPARSTLIRTLMELNTRMPPLIGSSLGVQIGSSLQSVTGATPPLVTDETRVFIYPTTYHPAVRTVREATVISVRSGEDRSTIDLDLKPLRATQVTGSVIGPDGPAGHVGLRLDALGDDIVSDPEATTVSDAAGIFTFPSVPSGQYTLRASRIPRASPTGMPVTIVQSGGLTISGVAGPPTPASAPPLPTEPTLWASVPVTVGQKPLTGLTVTLQTGSRMRGRIEFEGGGDKPDAAQLQRIAIFVEPEDGMMQRGMMPPSRVEPNGEFATGGVPGGRYLIRSPGGPPGWHFKGARYQDVDLADTAIGLDGRDVTGITIVFTDRPSELSGAVRNHQGSPDPDATILVFPVETERWHLPNPRRMRSLRVTKTGTYKITGLPAGDYYLAAVTDDVAVEWQSPRILESLAGGATKVSVDDGEKKVQDLRTQQKR